MEGVKRSRREFLSNVAIGAGAASAVLPVLGSPAWGVTGGEMACRPLGRTGEKVSLLGLGGWHFSLMPDDQYTTRFIRTAIDNGVNYVETSWDYHWGLSEYRIAKALEDGYRKKVFLATKINGRTKPFADCHLEDSLHRLRTDCIDLVQFHEVVNMSDADKIFGPNGAIDTLLAAKKAGKIRYIGFSGHAGPEPLLKLVNLGLKNGFTFDTAMITLNVMDPHFKSNLTQLVPLLQEHKIGIVAFKTMGGGGFVGKTVYDEAKGFALERIDVTPTQCLRYAMSLPVSVVISGIETLELLEENLRITRDFRPMTEAEISQLIAKTVDEGKAGKYEWWKTPKGLEWTRNHPDCFS